MGLDLYARIARHAALGERKPLLAALAALTGEPNEIAETLRRHHLLRLVCSVLREDDGGIAAALRSHPPARGVTVEKLLEAYGEIRHAFDRRGISSMLLKGFYFAERLYGGLERRPQYDVDLLVPRRDFRAAERLLREIGFARKSRDLHSHTLSRRAVHVDLHHSPRRSPAYSLDEAWVWRRAVEARVGTLSFRTLADEDYVTMLAASLFEDVGFGKGHLKQALDLYLLLRRNDGLIDWEDFFRDCESRRLLVVVTNALALVVDALATADELELLRASIQRHGNLVDHSGREQALGLLLAPRGCVDNLLWFGRIYPGSVLLYRARFWMRTFPGNLRNLDAGWLRRNAAYLLRTWKLGRRPASSFAPEATSTIADEPGGASSPALCTMVCDAVVIAVASNDGTAAAWLAEVLRPWFKSTSAPAEWRVRISSSARDHAALSARRPAEAPRRACFAFDRWVLSLPAWPADGRVVFADAERSCLLVVGPSRVDVVADPCTRRWRITAMWLLHEIVGSRLRHTQLDLHAAAVEASGRALLISGAKGAGKTTVSFHLLRSGHFRLIANDRTFVAAAGAPYVARGIPSAVRIRPPTLAEFPELCRGLPAVERPYLYTLDELAAATEGGGPPTDELLLSPAQLVRQFGVESLESAPLGAIVFPDIRPDAGGWTLARLDPEELETLLWCNLYGCPLDQRPATIFEELDGGPVSPSPEVAAALAGAVPGYRLVLGRDAYARADLVPRLREILA